ncbi:translocation/assembly module TamB [Flavobacteriaceae bacterium AU392]|nr:translocation/assembly module TamB [Flavobacteriaceae bacterium]RKM86154.1 translocation/assembly module TamB [Flavobacteriaceae bacterium AU392]
MLLLFIILVLLLSIPAIQTSLGKYTTEKINEDFGTNITIEKVGLQFNGDVELKGIYIEDHKQDTLISISELNTSIISFRKLYKGKLTFGDIDIENLFFNLKIYEEERLTNLDVFIAKFGTSATKSEEKFLLSSSDISVKDSRFVLIDENLSTPVILDFTNLNFNTTDFLVFGPDVSTRINKLSFFEKRGITLKNLQTNFAYSIKDMTFENLEIETEKSLLKGKLKFEYELKDMPQFVNKVQLIANFDDSTIALNELNKYYNEFGLNQYAKLKANFTGTLNDLTASNLLLTTSSQTAINGTLNFKNIFGKGDFVMEGDYNNLSSSRRDLNAILPNILGERNLPTSLDSLGRFTIKGKSLVTKDMLNTDVTIDTRLGQAISTIEMLNINNADKLTYSGNIVLEEFDLGTLIKNASVGKTSLNLDVNGKGFTLETLNTQVDGNIYNLDYNNYDYNGIDISGNIQDNIFNGELIANDENLDLKFNGLINFSEAENNYDFTANVTKANLNALNFVTKDSISVFQGLVKMDMKGTNIDNAYGSISFKNTLYKNQNEEYYFKDFAISSEFKNNIRYINVNSPDIIEGSLNGKFVFKDALKLIENSFGDIYANYNPHEIQENQFIDFNFKIYNKIAEVFLPELELGSNTFFRGHIESDAKKFNLVFNSPKIKLEDYLAKGIQLRLNNDNPLFNTYIEVDSVDTKYYKASDFSLINVTVNDTLIIKTQFKGGDINADDFNLNLYYTINENRKSVFGFNKSEVLFKNNEWFINEKRNANNKIIFDRNFKNIEFDNIDVSHLDESMKFLGVMRDSTYKDLNLEFKNVDLIKITPRIDSLALAGNVNGKLNIKQEGRAYLPESNIIVDDFKINNFNLGSFKANIVGYESLTNYDVNVSLKDDQKESLSVIGNLNVAGKNPTIDLEVNFNQFILNPLTPFGSGVITNIRGEVEGNVRVVGRLNRPNIIGNLDLDKGGLSVPYLNVDYEFADNTIVNLERQSFNFSNAQLTDSDRFSNANLSGSISHVNFSKWALDLDINSNRFLVLNTSDYEDALYYGTAFVGGEIEISGPVNQLVVNASVETEQGTVFVIPLNDAETFGTDSFIHFTTKEEKEAKLKGEEVVLDNISGLELDFDLDVNQNAEIEIVIDKTTGSTIRGRGDGGILTQINTNGKFNMFGDFIVNEGIYNFITPGVIQIQKEFKVQQGGNLVWEGDPLKAQMNIRAIHDGINANPSILLDNPTSQSIPVEVEIELTGQLEQPDINFNLNFPNVNSTINSELQYRLSDNDTKQFQALSLLATGSFKNDINFRSQDAFGLFSDGIKAILNDLLSTKDGKLQIGVDYQVGENTPEFQSDDRFIASLSTRLSDNILINGNVGVPIGGVSETVIAGNFEIEVLLNEDRTLSLKFFNRENSIRNFGEQIGYTQGIGLSYNVEFDSLKELFTKIFKRKKQRDKKEIATEEKVLPDFIGFKQKTTSNNKKNK